ncbi:hypothetical protein [Chelatococcus reniformis]|uniref:DUF308 domain-containing protein n=1 Tax=Chelatococcus reniformis TaxID=1494448 RepID=A0A916UIB8_9HYPH|nr:hypothetical protein [Chelatococcus reniformis]GGC73764.1 hypothetical protein GCM10010994_35180 [Chelatococcus reniformis]
MVNVLFVLALALVGGGFYSIYWGIPLIVMERGWTWIIAGSMFASSGFIVFALALIVRALHRLPDHLEAAHPELVPDVEAVAAAAPRTALRPALPDLPGQAPKAPSVPPLVPLKDDEADGVSKPAGEKAPERAVPVRAERDTPIVPPAGRDGAVEPLDERDTRITVSETMAPPPRVPLPLGSRPAQPDEAARTSRIGALFGRVRDRAAPPVPPILPEPAEATADVPIRTERPGPLRPERPDPLRPEPAEPPRPEWPERPEPLRAERPEPRPPAPEPAEEPLEEALDEPVDEPASTPASEAAQAASPTVVGTYTAGSTLYVMYSDGSIEAETATGVLRFASLDALKEHVSKGEMS